MFLPTQSSTHVYQVYDAQKGAFGELGMLDVQQIFGRAGRPQFDTSGEGIIITTHDKLPHYLGMLTHQVGVKSVGEGSDVTTLHPLRDSPLSGLCL